MNNEHCLESCWLPVEPSRAGEDCFKFKWSIGHSLLMTMFKFTNQCGLCTIHLWTSNVPLILQVTRNESWRNEVELWERENQRRECDREESRQQLSAFITAGVLHMFLLYPASTCTKCNTIKWIVFEVKSASIITGRGCWQCGSIESGIMVWGKDHDRTQNIASQLSFIGPCNTIIQQLWWVAPHLRIKILGNLAILSAFKWQKPLCLNVQCRLLAKLVAQSSWRRSTNQRMETRVASRAEQGEHRAVFNEEESSGESGTMDWGKDHGRTQTVPCNWVLIGPCNTINQQLWWVAPHLRNR